MASPAADRAKKDFERYLGAIAEADRLIGNLINQLKTSGAYENTLIVITGDHGQTFGQRGTFGNGASVFEESVHVPLLLISPRLKRHGRLQRLSSQLDIGPTIIDALRLDPPRGMDGYSLFRSVPIEPVYFANFTADRVLGYRFGDRKVIANLVRDQVQIFNLTTDPGEQHDLAPALPRRVIDHERDWISQWGGSVNRK